MSGVLRVMSPRLYIASQLERSDSSEPKLVRAVNIKKQAIALADSAAPTRLQTLSPALAASK